MKEVHSTNKRAGLSRRADGGCLAAHPLATFFLRPWPTPELFSGGAAQGTITTAPEAAPV